MAYTKIQERMIRGRGLNVNLKRNVNTHLKNLKQKTSLQTQIFLNFLMNFFGSAPAKI